MTQHNTRRNMMQTHTDSDVSVSVRGMPYFVRGRGVLSIVWFLFCHLFYLHIHSLHHESSRLTHLFGYRRRRCLSCPASWLTCVRWCWCWFLRCETTMTRVFFSFWVRKREHCCSCYSCCCCCFCYTRREDSTVIYSSSSFSLVNGSHHMSLVGTRRHLVISPCWYRYRYRYRCRCRCRCRKR